MNIYFKNPIIDTIKVSLSIFKAILSLIFTFLFLAPIVIAPKLVNIEVQMLIFILSGVILATYINWAIWTKGTVKKLIMFPLIFCWLSMDEYLPYVKGFIEINRCVSLKICTEGIPYNSFNKMSKEYCENNNWTWNEKRKECKIIK